MKIVLILGTARKNNNSSKIANYVRGVLESDEQIDCLFVPVEEYVTRPYTTVDWADPDGFTERWKDIAENADGFFIVTPEYNHSFPGELKMLLDQTLSPYAHKPVVTCCVSKGYFSGARAAEHLVVVLNKLGLVRVKSILLGKVADAFVEEELVDEQCKKHVEESIRLLKAYVPALKKVRETLK